MQIMHTCLCHIRVLPPSSHPYSQEADGQKEKYVVFCLDLLGIRTRRHLIASSLVAGVPGGEVTGKLWTSGFLATRYHPVLIIYTGIS